MLPLLETSSGLRAGVDFALAFSPERIDPGNPRYGVQNTPKVVGGLTPSCTQRAVDFYHRFIDTVVQARGTREAEMATLLENTCRYVNIPMVNETAQFCHELDIDLWNVIELPQTTFCGFQACYPGIGVGGHCIPIDPNCLAHRVEQELGHPSASWSWRKRSTRPCRTTWPSARPEPAQRQPNSDQRFLRPDAGGHLHGEHGRRA